MKQPSPPRSQQSLPPAQAPVNAFRRLVVAQGAPLLVAGLVVTVLGYRDADEIVEVWMGLWTMLVIPSSLALTWLAARIDRRVAHRAPVARGLWLPTAAAGVTLSAWVPLLALAPTQLILWIVRGSSRHFGGMMAGLVAWAIVAVAAVVWVAGTRALTRRAEGRVAKEMAVDPKKYSLGKKTLFASDLDNEEYTQAKKSSPDEKFPTVPLRALEGDHLKALARKHGLTFSENPTEDELIAIITAHQEKLVAEKKVWNWKWIVPGTTGKGESNPMCLSDRDDSVFIAMTDRENKAHGLDGKLPFLEGMMANMVDTRSAWIQRARELEMPLRAGPSGTTFRTMNYAAQLGGINLPGMRLGMLGHLIPTNAHSYHEVMVAAQGHVPYLGQGKYSPLDPVPDAEMRRMAKEAAGGVEERVDPILGINE